MANAATLWAEAIACDDIPAGLPNYARNVDAWAALEDQCEVLSNVIEILAIGNDSEIKDLLGSSIPRSRENLSFWRGGSCRTGSDYRLDHRSRFIDEFVSKLTPAA